MSHSEREVFAGWVDAMFRKMVDRMNDEGLPYYSLAMKLPSPNDLLEFEMVLKITKKELEK